MPNLQIDNLTIAAPAGTTILLAARDAGIEIPTLCHMPGKRPLAACMACAVQDRKSGRFLPACSAQVSEGMEIETTGESIQSLRRSALELLLSNHLGDCLAPCRRPCPLQLDIPGMLAELAAGDELAARRIVRRDLPLASVLSPLCHAPCENGCRRKGLDTPLHINRIEQQLAAPVAAAEPEIRPGSSGQVTIIGETISGLAAAHFLLLAGFGCVLDAVEPGDPVLAVERAALAARGLQSRSTPAPFAAALESRTDAIVLAVETLPADTLAALALEPCVSDARIAVARSQKWANVFAAGALVQQPLKPIHAAAAGQAIARLVSSQLNEAAAADGASFRSRAGRLTRAELSALMPDVPFAEDGDGLDWAVTEALRCGGCECQSTDCRLRALATATGARQSRLTRVRGPLQPQVRHAGVVFEPGKCIQCGRCVQIAESARETAGLTLVGRGFDVQVAAALGSTLAEVLAELGRECVAACPTGALLLERHGS